MVFHIIGDSHGNIFLNLPNFTFKQHSVCAHSLIKDKYREVFLEYLRSNVQKDDHVILIFGEIDCRLHFHYQSQKQNRSISDLIDDTIRRYGLFGKMLSEIGIDFAFYNVVPTGSWAVLDYGNGMKTCEMELRKRIYREFHDKLATYCRENNYKIIDMWDLIAGDYGFTKQEYRQDEVHLNTAVLPIALKEIARVFSVNDI